MSISSRQMQQTWMGELGAAGGAGSGCFEVDASPPLVGDAAAVFEKRPRTLRSSGWMRPSRLSLLGVAPVEDVGDHSALAALFGAAGSCDTAGRSFGLALFAPKKKRLRRPRTTKLAPFERALLGDVMTEARSCMCCRRRGAGEPVLGESGGRGVRGVCISHEAGGNGRMIGMRVVVPVLLRRARRARKGKLFAIQTKNRA